MAITTLGRSGGWRWGWWRPSRPSPSGTGLTTSCSSGSGYTQVGTGGLVILLLLTHEHDKHPRSLLCGDCGGQDASLLPLRRHRQHRLQARDLRGAWVAQFGILVTALPHIMSYPVFCLQLRGFTSARKLQKHFVPLRRLSWILGER